MSNSIITKSLALFLLVSVGVPHSGTACAGTVNSPTFVDIKGVKHTPLDSRGAKAVVMFFVVTDCPIANYFTSEINAIVKDHATKNVRFFVVHVDPELTPTAAGKHARDYGFTCPVLIDAKHVLVKATGASITPEAVVQTPDGKIAYRGRIDDRYVDLGKRRIEPNRRDVREALAAVLAGQPVKEARTKAIGCPIPDVDGELPTASAGASEKGRTNWPTWRGPTQDGHAADARVPLQWSRTKNLKWSVELPGTGNSSPVVWDHRIFLTAATRQGDERWVLCIDRTSGKTLWQRSAVKELPPEPTHEWNTHASATCVTDGQRVYAFFGTPGLFCYDIDGKLLWKKSFGILGSSTGWAAGAASPILFEDLVIVNGDQGALRGQVNEKGIDYGSSWLWALNKQTGEVVWKTLRNQGMGWCTPIIWVNQGRQELVLNGQLGVWSYEPRTGKELWQVTGRKDGEGFGEVTPIWGHGLMYVFTGKPGPAWAIRPGSAGDISSTHLAWQIQRKDRDVSSPILVGDYIYTISRIGVATCLEAKTGKEQWRERLGGQPCASLLCIRDKVMFLNEEGTAFIVEPGPQFRLLHENPLGNGDAFRASPAVIDGQLLLRSNRRLYCIAVAADDKESTSTAPKARVLQGHRGSVMSLAYSPDGKVLASGSRDRTVRLWNAATGELLRTLEGHTADVHAVAFAADGNVLATASADKTIGLWDVRTGALLKTFTGHTAIVRSVHFAPDQKTLVSAGVDMTIRLWDLSTGKVTQTLTGHTARVMTVVYSPDGRTLASASSDKTARLWDVHAGTVKAVFEGHDGGLEAAVFSPDGMVLASSGQDGTVRLWDVLTEKVRHVLKGHIGEIDSVAFSPNGKLVASGCKDQTAKLWDAQTGQLLQTLTGHSGRVESLTFSPDGRTFATGGGGGDTSVRFWDITGIRN